MRELGNILERALVRCREQVIDLRHLEIPGLAPAVPRAHAASILPAADAGDGLDERAAAGGMSEVTRPGDPAFPKELPIHLPSLERLAIGEALRLENGNRTRAARRLGLSLRTLRNKLRDYRSGSDTADAADRQDLLGSDDRADRRDRSPTLARS